MRLYVYMLLCADDSYFTGITDDLNMCIFQHQLGMESKYTSSRLPVRYVFYEGFSKIDEAVKRKKQIQGWRRDKKEALIDKCSEKLPDLSKAYRDLK